MSRLTGPLGVLAVLVLSAVFAALNGQQRVTVDLGFFVLYRVPVTVVAFASLFTGMLVMLVAGVHTDLKVRAILRQRLEEEDREERALIDRAQQDLFLTPDGEAPGRGPTEAPPEEPKQALQEVDDRRDEEPP